MTCKQVPPVLAALLVLAFPAAAPAANQSVTANFSNQFSPASVTLSQGESVTWTNSGGIHNVHFDDNSFDQPPSPSSSAWSVSRTFLDVGMFRYYCEVHGGPGGVGMSGTVTVSAASYARPSSATPLRVPLVPAYSACTSTNSTHVAPLSFPSCTPPQQESTLLTTPSAAGTGSGFGRLRAIVGNPAPPDDSDLAITASATSVIRRSNSTAYTGKTILATTIRVTDRANGASGLGSATVQDARFALPVDCTNGSCSLNTTADTLIPNFIKEGKRAVIEAFSINLEDAGADGSIGAAVCAPNCGTGDEKVFMRQGVFTP